MGKRLPKTIKEKKFVKEYLKTGNATEAAAKVYDVKDRKSAGAIGGENLKKLTIVEIMEKNGLTDEKITNTLLEGMEANKSVGANVIIVKGKPDLTEPNLPEADSKTIDFIDVPDWTARLKATELASKIKGHLKDKVDITSGGKELKTSMVEFVIEDVKDKTSQDPV